MRPAKKEASPAKKAPPPVETGKTTTVRKKREVAKQPENEETFRALLQENKAATARSLKELQNELRRMAGRRPMTDYTPRGEDFSEYQVNVEELAQQIVAKTQIPEYDDSDSDTVSSDDEAPLPPIEPARRPVEKVVERPRAVEKRQEEKRQRPVEEPSIVKKPVVIAPAPAPASDEKQARLATEKAIEDFKEKKKQEMISAVRKDIGNRNAITEQGWQEIADFEKLQWIKFFQKYHMKDFIATIKSRGTYKDLLAKFPK
jgi:hypothetical protein